MFSQETKQRLVSALADQGLADDLERRLFQKWVGTGDAQAALDSYQEDTAKLREWLVVALAQQEAGDELADRLEKAEDILRAVADGDEVAGSPAIAASFTGQVVGMTEDVTIEADNEGEAGNSIILGVDGIMDLDALIAGWNIAYPSNTISLTDGDGSQIPELNIALSGGEDEVLASDENTSEAIAAFGTQSISESTMERLTVALASEDAAAEFKAQYDEWIIQMND